MTTTPARLLTRSVTRRDLLRQAAVAGAAVPAAGLLDRGRRIARAADPLKVGAIIPFTGIETHNGLSMKYGLEIGADEINAAGGLAGRQVELFQEDDGGDVGRGVRAAQKLIQQTKIDFLNGTLTSSVRTAVFKETAETRTLFLNPTF